MTTVCMFHSMEQFPRFYWTGTLYWIVKKEGLPVTRTGFLFLPWAGNGQVLLNDKLTPLINSNCSTGICPILMGIQGGFIGLIYDTLKLEVCFGYSAETTADLSETGRYNPGRFLIMVIRGSRGALEINEGNQPDTLSISSNGGFFLLFQWCERKVYFGDQYQNHL